MNINELIPWLADINKRNPKESDVNNLIQALEVAVGGLQRIENLPDVDADQRGVAVRTTMMRLRYGSFRRES